MKLRGVNTRAYVTTITTTSVDRKMRIIFQFQLFIKCFLYILYFSTEQTNERAATGVFVSKQMGSQLPWLCVRSTDSYLCTFIII